MSILATDLANYAAANRPVDDATASGGGIDITYRPVLTQLGATARAVRVLSDGVDTRQVTITGRLTTGILDTEVLTLTGTTPVVGAKVWERVLKVAVSAAHASRTVTVTDSASTAMGTIPPNEVGICALFLNAASDPAAPQYRYEKIFWKNNHATLALLNAVVMLVADPSADIQIGLAAAVGDSVQVANRLTAPGGVVFSGINTSLAVPGGNLGPGQAIGLWVKQSLDALESAKTSSFTTQLKGSSI